MAARRAFTYAIQMNHDVLASNSTPPFILHALLLVGCTASPIDSGGTTPATPQNLTIMADNIREWGLSPNVDSTELCEGCDVTMDWSTLTTSLTGRSVDPLTDIDTVTLYVFDETKQDALLRGLLSQTLDQSHLYARWSCVLGETRSNLSDCAFVGHPLVPTEDFVETWGQWLLMLHGGEPARLRTMAVLVPSAEATLDRLELAPNSASLETGEDTKSAIPIEVEAQGELIWDWTELATNSWGAPLLHAVLDRFQVDRIEPNELSTAELVLSLDDLSHERWTADILGQTQVSASSLEGDRPFPVIDEESEWIVTAWCSTCELDLPIFLTTLTR